MRVTAAQPWLLPSAHIRIRLWLDEVIGEAGLPPLNVRVECDTVNLSHCRLLCGTDMLGFSSAWMAPAMRRFGLEVLPIKELGEIAAMRRAGGYVSPLSARLEELLLVGTRRRPAAS